MTEPVLDPKVIAEEGKILRTPAQKEYAYTLITEFDKLHTSFADFQAVKLLFSLDNSPNFDVKAVVEKLDEAAKKPDETTTPPANGATPADAATNAADTNGFPPALDLEFIKAGFPLPADKTTQKGDAKYGETKWAITTVLPEDEISAANTTYTIKLDGEQLDIYANSDDPALLIQYRIGLIDAIISRQLSAIMHDERFQQLEAAWRGLHDLVFNSETGTRLQLRLLNVPKAILQEDLDNAVEFDQSGLFKKVYEEEYGVFGGSPYSALLVDYAFTRQPKDISLLEKLSNVAAAAHAPIITSAHPELFDLTSFTDLDKPRDLAKIFAGAEYIKWRSFRDSEDARYVALTLPHVLMRLPYGPRTIPVGEFDFAETAEKPADFLWGNAAWALGLRMTTAFSRYSWTAAIRGYEGGGLVSGLPIYTYKTDHGDVAVRIPTEVAITDRREKELSDLGFIGLCYRKETDTAAFFGGQTANKPKVYMEETATANARLSAQLPYILAASRFAHYIKVMMRDKVGSFLTQDNVATFLNRWIAQYVLLNDSAGQETKARYPLREARVDVTADPARPGCYRAVVFLRPHFQLEELTVSIRLVTQLPPPANA